MPTPSEIATAHNMTVAAFLTDIPLDLARRAHAGTSHVPETRGDQEIADYALVLASDYLTLAALCGDDDAKICGALADEFQRYRDGYRARYMRALAAKSRCISTMITGASKFPVNRARKASDAADRAVADLLEYRKRAMKAIRRTLDPSSGPIKAGDDDAIERLELKLTNLLLAQEQMKEANAAIRANRAKGPEAQIAALVELGFTEKLAAEALTPDPLGRVGFPDYALKNNLGQIASVRKRIEHVTAAKATAAERIEGVGGAYVEIDPPADRVRLHLPMKPDVEVRNRLKRNGFRWAPSQNAWSAYNRTHSVETAKTIAGCGLAALAAP